MPKLQFTLILPYRLFRHMNALYADILRMVASAERVYTETTG